MLQIKNYFLIFFVAIGNILCLWLIELFANWWVVGGALIVWLSILFFLYYQNYKDEAMFRQNVALFLATQLSTFSLFILIEWEFLRWCLLFLGSFFLAFTFVRTHNEEQLLSFQQKPFRRLKMMLWVFNTYALFTLLFALNVFFGQIPFSILILFGSVLSGFSALLIWRMYFAVPIKSLLLWAVIVGLIMIELMWLMHLWPLGYLVLGGLTVWFWFLTQLFIRFHLSPEGVVWQKQRLFLGFNLVLIVALLLWTVRWI